MNNAFETVVGYKDIKNELMRFCDILKNTEKYEKLGVHIPPALLLYGDPGTGKTTMAKAFIAATERECFVCRKTKSKSDFLSEIVGTFVNAENCAPSVVFLDDLDKFTERDGYQIDAEEFVTVQSCIDEINGKDVFVIATVNDFDKLPESLCRAGRFGKTIHVGAPEGRDAEDVVRYYLRNKKISEEVDIPAVAKMLNGQSCAALEEVVNEAGILAGYAGRDSISMDDMLEAILNEIFKAPKANTSSASDNGEKIAYHEAGHLVISEILDPGSVTIASIRNRTNCSGAGGFTVTSDNGGLTDENARFERNLLMSLAGKAATEIVYGCFDIGADQDLRRAFSLACNKMKDFCAHGFDKHSIYRDPSAAGDRMEAAAADELERVYAKTKLLLIKNRDFLDAAAKALTEKDTVIAKDIAEIRSKCRIAA